MSEKKPFSGLRMSRAADDHGVTELLRQVAERSSLNEEERKEVSNIVKRVEKKAGERKTPMGKFQKKLKDNIETTVSELKDNIETINEKVHQTIGKDVAGDEGTASTDDNDDNDSLKSSSSESVNKWGKDLLHKFQNPLQTPSKGGHAAGEYFKNFTLKGMQNPLKTPGAGGASSTKSAENFKARHQKFVKAFERSSQSGRDFFKKASTNFENSLKNLESSLDSFSVGNQTPSPEAEYDVNSPEYKLDLKGIALLKEIFPHESTENLIKMHFEHVNATKNVK